MQVKYTNFGDKSKADIFFSALESWETLRGEKTLGYKITSCNFVTFKNFLLKILDFALISHPWLT